MSKLKGIVLGGIIAIVVICTLIAVFILKKKEDDMNEQIPYESTVSYEIGESAETIMGINGDGEEVVADGMSSEESELVSKILTDHSPDQSKTYTVVSLSRETLVVKDVDGVEYTIEYDYSDYAGN